MTLLSGSALSPELLGRYSQLSKDCDPVSVLRVPTAWSLVSLPSPASHTLDLLHHTATPSLAGTWTPFQAGTLSAPSRVRYGADEALKNAGPQTFSRPTPQNGQGGGGFFRIPCPGTPLRLHPTHTLDRSPLKISSNKWGPVQGLSAGAGWGLPEK